MFTVAFITVAFWFGLLLGAHKARYEQLIEMRKLFNTMNKNSATQTWKD